MISTIRNGRPFSVREQAGSYLRSSDEKSVTYQDLSHRYMRFPNTYVSGSGGFRD